jgi:hypothetical protein
MLTTTGILAGVSVACLCGTMLAAYAADGDASVWVRVSHPPPTAGDQTPSGNNSVAVPDTPGKEHQAGRVTSWEHVYEFRPGSHQAPGLHSLRMVTGLDALFRNGSSGAPNTLAPNPGAALTRDTRAAAPGVGEPGRMSPRGVSIIDRANMPQPPPPSGAAASVPPKSGGIATVPAARVKTLERASGATPRGAVGSHQISGAVVKIN